ncbi:MAG: hypothetical protein B7O98_08845 [Zestosphaera tikiterensis]|uniref:ORC1-type DNA replication protein n=1 Tax=Zestosphaera tikiterensis TaxID=1973259 RepID=A0A2R7Y2G5_9CREN|nr:MAG: hypothetical protein B7O98_08675 [Zestosphaera tikiterensis]PUA31720.1 MAG: hypothetical protein B7O98_08845 [Zestosphaera tikiterensis]
MKILNIEALFHDYIPSSLPCREVEYSRIAEEFMFVDKGFMPSNIVVLGPTGSGKTVTVRKVLSDMKVNYVYTVADKLAYATLVSIAENLIKKRLWGFSFADVWRRLDEALDKNVTIVIDEAERFIMKDERSDELLYYLSRRPKTSVILISKVMNVLDYVRDAGVRSSLRSKVVVFKPYNADELLRILTERAREAFEGDFAEEGVLSYISAIAAQRGGDARYAIDILREAVKWALKTGSEKITLEHAEKAKKSVEERYVEESMSALSTAQKLMLLAAVKSRTVGEAYRNFNELAMKYLGTTYSERRLRDILGELEEMGFISIKREKKSWIIEKSTWLPKNIESYLTP